MSLIIMLLCLGKVFKRIYCLILILGIYILFNYDLYKIEKNINIWSI